MMAIRPNLGIVARAQQLLGGEPTENGHGDHAFSVSASMAQLRFSTTKTSGLSLSLRIASWFPPLACSNKILASVRHHRRVIPSAPMSRSASAPTSTRAKPVGPRRQRRVKGLGRARRNLALKFDMPRGALAQHTHLPIRQRTYPGRGMESQLDVAAEIAFVVDVAREAMCAFRQVLKPAHAGLRAAAARAEQLPSHRHDALPRRRQKQLHRIVGLGRPQRRQRRRTNAAQIDDRRMPKVIDEVRPKSMRGRIAREFGPQRIESLAGGGLRQVLNAPAGDKRGTLALANDPLDRRRRLAGLSIKDAGMRSHES